jgi:hypothetical protein
MRLLFADPVDAALELELELDRARRQSEGVKLHGRFPRLNITASHMDRGQPRTASVALTALAV